MENTNNSKVYSELVKRDDKPKQEPTFDYTMAGGDGHLSNRYFRTRNFLALLEKKKKEEVKLWQQIPPHYTDFVAENLETRRRIDYLRSLANHAHLNVRKIYKAFLPWVVLAFVIMACLFPAEVLANAPPNALKLLFALTLPISFINLPLYIWAKKYMHDVSYKYISDPIGKKIFTYFEVGEYDKNFDNGYTRKEILDVIKKHEPNFKEREEDIAKYLQNILEVEIERKTRGYVYYLNLKEKYIGKEDGERFINLNRD